MNKKLIEVALPLEVINRESAREKEPFTRNHPRSMHIWWARRPLAACRAVLFASLVDDPSSRPDLFPTEEEQVAERDRLFRVIEALVAWENAAAPQVIDAARTEIRRCIGEERLTILDPFCGAGSIPLEAQRLGLRAVGRDLNPVAVLVTKAQIEIPSKFSGRAPINPETEAQFDVDELSGSRGLAADVEYYGKWLTAEAEKRLRHLYPRTTAGGRQVDVNAWIWARTVRCPNPGCGIEMPLVRTFALSTKNGKEAWIEPAVVGRTVKYTVRAGKGRVPDGTVNRQGATCIACNSPVPLSYIREEGQGGRIGTALMAVVPDLGRGRAYASAEEDAMPELPIDIDAPESEIPKQALGFRVQAYGMTRYRDLFTPRQLLTITTLVDIVRESIVRVTADADKSGRLGSDTRSLSDGGDGPRAYAEAIAIYLGLAVSRWTDLSNTICSWNTTNQNIRALFARQAIPMAWDFVEANPLGSLAPVGSAVDSITSALRHLVCDVPGLAEQRDAATDIDVSRPLMIATDPPYYDNIGYADLSDFFYVWLRPALKEVLPDLFSTLLTPKTQELIATPFRFEGSRSAANAHFETGLGIAFERMREAQSAEFPLSVFYAFKQSETEGEGGSASTGWETMLEGLLRAGLSVHGTWPMRTERGTRAVALDTAALASSILLVCRPRQADAGLATRKELIGALKDELPGALRKLQQGNIAPVDLAQAAIGPGIGVFSRYAKVVEADGSAMSVRTALALINQVLDETLAEQEGDFDADTRWAIAWFEQNGMNQGSFGTAETLSKAKNTAVNGLVTAGIVESKAGKVRLLDRNELSASWEPIGDRRLTVWEVAQHLIRALEHGGEVEAAALAHRVGGLAEAGRELAYRLYTVCERKRWAKDAISYNALVVAWPEISRLASGATSGSAVQDTLL
jgi:putative DNA methylase